MTDVEYGVFACSTSHTASGASVDNVVVMVVRAGFCCGPVLVQMTQKGELL